MAGPWDKYQQAVPGLPDSDVPGADTTDAMDGDGPWSRYQTPSFTAPDATEAQQAPAHPEAPLQGKLAGTLRSLEQGASFGFGDEINAGLRSTFGKEKYGEALADERAKNAQFSEQHPVISTVSEIAGGVPMMFLPGMQGVTGAKYLANAKTALQAAKRSSAVGAGFGSIAGFGHGEGGLQNRAENALQAGAVSGAMAAPLGYAGYKLGEAIGGVRTARDEATGPASSQNYVAKKLRADNIDIDNDILAKMFPTGGRRFTQDEMQDIVTRLKNGETQQQIAAAYGAAPSTVGRVSRGFEEQTQTPLTIVDRAKLVRPGSGQNTEWGQRAAALTDGDARRLAYENLTERQIGQGPRLMDAVTKYIGDGSDDSIKAAQAVLKRQEDAAYTAARANEQPFNITPILDAWNQNIKNTLGASSEVGQGVKNALNAFYDETSVANPMGTNYLKTYTPINNLQRFQGAKGSLDTLIENSKKDGRPTFLTANLKQLKDDLMNEIGTTNPQWKLANDTFTGAGTRALKAGEALPMRLNSKSRDILNQFRQYAKQAQDPNPDIAAAGRAQLDLFRQGMSRAIQDGLQNNGATNDLSRQLLLPGSQKVMREVLGTMDRLNKTANPNRPLQKSADTLIRLLREEQAGTSTFNKIRGGSQTTPLANEAAQQGLGARIASAAEWLSPKHLLASIIDQTAGRMRSGRNDAVMKMLTEMDPVEQLQILRGVKNVAQGRQVGGVNANRALLSVSNPLAGSGDYQGRQEAMGRGLKGGMGPDYDAYGNRRYAAGGGIGDSDDDDDTGGIMPFLENNPHGSGNSPLKYGQSEGEIRNPDDPYSGTGGPSLPSQMAYDLSGIPTVLEGIRLGREGSNEGDPTKMLQGIGEVGLGAAPAAMTRVPATVLRGGAKLVGAGLGAAVGSAAINDMADADSRQREIARRRANGKQTGRNRGSAASAPAAASVAPAPDDGLEKLANGDPQAMALLQQYRQLYASGHNDVGGPNYPADKAQLIRDKDLQDAATAYEKFLARVDEINAAHQPFDKRWPTVAQTLPYVTALGPMVAGAALGANAKMADNLDIGAWRNAVNRAEQLIEEYRNGAPSWQFWKSRPGLNQVQDAIETAAQSQAAMNPPKSSLFDRGAAFAKENALPAGIGATVGFESRALPYQYNRNAAPEGSDERKQAEAYLNDPRNSVGPALWGALGGTSGYHFGKAFFPGRRAPNAETDALKTYLSPERGNRSDILARNLDVPGPDAPVPGAPAGGPTGPSGGRGPTGLAQQLRQASKPDQSGSQQAPSGLAPSGLGRSSTGTGGLGEPPATVAGGSGASETRANMDTSSAESKLKSLQGPVTGRGIGDLPLPSRGPAPKATPKDKPAFDENHPNWRTRGAMGRWVSADDAEAATGSMTGATRDAHNAMRDEIQAWIDRNPDRGSIPRSVIENAAKSVGSQHRISDVQALIDSAMKYLGN